MQRHRARGGHSRRAWKTVLAGGLAAATLLATALPASASHFRASVTTTTFANGVVTWHVDGAWRKTSNGTFFGGNSANMTLTRVSNGTTVTGLPRTLVTAPQNTTDPLFDLSSETLTVDMTSLLGSPDTYQFYRASSARVAGVRNTSGNDSFSQAMAVTVNPGGTVSLPPQFDHDNLYTLIPIAGTSELSLDYRATDPEGTAVTYQQLTSPTGPDFGATALPCSSFTGGVLRLSAALCPGGTTFSSQYSAGDFYAVKVKATDADGQFSETDTLLRVPVIPTATLPAPTSVTSTAPGTIVVPVGLVDTDTSVDTYSVTCTNTADPADVRTGTGTTRNVQVSGLTDGASYSCVATATNGLGGNPSASTTYRTQSVAFSPTAALPATAAPVTLTATASSGLPVTYASSTPAVCTVSGATLTVVAQGTCSLLARQAGDSTYVAASTAATVLVAGAPAPAASSSTGSGTTPQSVTVPVGPGQSVTLLDASGTPTTTVTVPGQGTYVLDPATGAVTFTPVLGFAGTATPVTVRVTDAFGQAGTSTYTPTVTAPPAPAPAPRTSSGTGTGTQTVRVPVPAGGSVTLLDAAGAPAATVVVPGQGTYLLDPATGTVSFVPVAGFSGTSTPVVVQVTDAYGQVVRTTYAATVSSPTPTAAAPVSSTGGPGAVQSAIVAIPSGGSVTLLDAQGRPSTRVVVPGQGVYSLDVTTGVITFTAAAGFTGRATPVTFRVTDAYAQTSSATYAASVVGGVTSPTATLTAVRARGAQVATSSATRGTLPTTCRIDIGRISRCTVTAYATVSGRRVVVGTGTGVVATGVQTHAVRATVQLTAVGRALAARPGGVPLALVAAATARGPGSAVVATTRARVVANTLVAPRPVFFDTSRAVLRPGERSYLAQLRNVLIGVRVIRCDGFTDSRGGAENATLARARASATCAFLARGTAIRAVVVSHGETSPVGDNATSRGRSLNRRTDVRFGY
ncbi:CshA-type fibril repeat protein [Motilibacter peucedani]|uniref:CshA-type fibril repeat protein n=1 Tax=Motilibacter peucedani TaxID=598650 RepID=A0A420XKN0_9ACTN|nr:hypothetical protein [Motilibacter peucedani]RKS69224.1 CshA-type fibril repeat protein [Motilibacter peucedani]